MNLDDVVQAGSVDELFSMTQLDQRPRPINRVNPRITEAIREQGAGTVRVIFVVTKEGRVEHAKVKRSDHPAYNKPALRAVRQWRFEPGKRQGRPVRFRMSLPIRFPETG
jgi:protein TonB